MPETKRLERLKFLSPEEVRHISELFGTPVFVYDERSIEQAVDYMASLPSAFGLAVRYSLKACPSQAVIRIFDRLGCRFDASSVWEAERARQAGVSAEKILLTGQEATLDDRLMEAVKDGLEFDAGSLRQLEAYGRAFPGGRVSIRINPGFGSGLVNRLTSGGPNSSFGIWHEYLPDVEKILRSYDLSLVRLHTHIGSGHHKDVLLPAARLMLALAHDFPDVETIDLGGGYRIKALLDDPEYDHREWAELLSADMTKFERQTGRRLRLELEPGTFLMANSGSIVTQIIDVVDTGPEGHRFVKLNAGLTEIIRPSYYGAPHPLVCVPAAEPSTPREVRTYCVAGHCCIAGDVLTIESGNVESLRPVPLPSPEPGDLLVIERGGGYTTSMALKNFNSYPEAPEVLRRDDGRFDLVRERQTLDQIIANELVPADL